MSEAVDFGLIIPLKEEFHAFIDVVGPLQRIAPNSRYYPWNPQGSRDGDPYRGIVTFVGEAGGIASALAADELIRAYHPRTLVVTGIAGGIDSDVRVGDIVVASQVDDFLRDSKAAKAAARRGKPRGPSFQFKLSGRAHAPTADLARRVDDFDTEPEPHAEWAAACARELERQVVAAAKREELLAQDLIRPAPRILQGHIAASEAVSAAAQFGKWLKDVRDRKFLAIEMESHGVLESALGRRDLELPLTVVLRAISDYGDERKKELDRVGGGGLRRYAMGNAVRLFRALLRRDFLPRAPHSVASKRENSGSSSGPEITKSTIPIPGGPYDKQVYVPRRKLEEGAVRHIVDRGKPVVIQGPFKSGKRWLLEGVLERLRARLGASYRPVLVDMNLLSLEDTASGFSKGLARQFAAAAEVPADEVDRIWTERLTKFQKLTRFVESLEKRTAGAVFVLVIKGAEEFRCRSYQKDFENVLRAWGGSLRHVRILMTISTTPARDPESLYGSPFNTPHQIFLDGFERTEVRELAKVYGVDWDPQRLDRLAALTGNNPYLLSEAFQAARTQGASIDGLLDQLGMETGPFAGYLRDLDKLLKVKEVRLGVESVLRGRSIDPLSAVWDRLHRARLARKVDGVQQIRCPLYEAHFRVVLGIR